MNRNIKSIFFVLTLITLLIAVGAVSAADDADSTNALDSSVGDAVGSDTDSNQIAAESVQTTSNDNNVNTKTIEKEDKNLKRGTKTVEANNYNDITSAINNAVKDPENDTYIINLNEGTYSIGSTTLFSAYPNNYPTNIIINANYQVLTNSSRSSRLTLYNGCNLTINQATINHMIESMDQGCSITLNQVILNSRNIYNYEGNELIFLNSTINLPIYSYGTLIIDDNTILTSNANIIGSGVIITNNTNIIYPYTNTFDDGTLKDMTIDKDITVNGEMNLNNVTINKTITNNGKVIISDDTTFTDTCIITGNGEIEINDTSRIVAYLDTYNANYTLDNIIINTNKTNNQNLTIINSTINATIENNGILYIDDNTILTENAQITGLGEIITDNITRILPYIETITGNYTITDTALNKTYIFYGNITLENCNITSTDNINYNILNLIDTNIVVDEETNWITNYGMLIIDENSNTMGNLTNYGEVYTGNLPEDLTYDPTYHVVNNDTIAIYFDNTKGNIFTKLVNDGDTFDFQGTISGIPGLTSLVINKAVNIITSTNDGRIENFSSITYNNGSSGSNITGLYTYNTQFYVRNAHNMVFNNISNVVKSANIGWGVGQTSIGHNSTNITVQNSYFYTKDNGGSSTFVFNWADNSTLINSTVEADGNVGNLVYLTTYNVDIPMGVIPNTNNKILNNTIRGPERAAGICWGIVLSGTNNLVDGNTINYTGTGITGQWGSGVTGDYNDEQSLIDLYGNTVSNNKLYNGSNIQTGNIIYNNYVEKGGIYANNSRVYNNTAAGLTIGSGEILVTNNTINGKTTVNSDNRTNVLIENNTLKNIEINGNNTLFKNNNITSITNDMVTSNATFINNNITDTITLAQRSLDFTFIENNINGKINLQCNNSIWTNNTITGNINIGSMEGNNNQFTTNNITGNIYLNSSWYATGNSFINNNIEGYIQIITIEGTNNTIIKNNTIITDQPYTITQTKPVTHALDVSNYTITDNYLKANGTYGDNSVNINQKTNTITNNTPKIELRIDTTEFTVGQTTDIKASIYLEYEKITNITKGKVTFKVNGKTLKDANGKVIYVNIVNGTATIENYLIPDDWTKEGTTIEAIYAGSTQCPKLTSEKTNLTVTPKELSLTIGDVTATAGTTTTLTATLSDNTINNGKIIFKVNGKTVKDENGKVIYAKVVNGTVSVNYQIPDSMKAGNYNITATFIASGYDHIEASESLTVTNE